MAPVITLTGTTRENYVSRGTAAFIVMVSTAKNTSMVRCCGALPVARCQLLALARWYVGTHNGRFYDTTVASFCSWLARIRAVESWLAGSVISWLLCYDFIVD